MRIALVTPAGPGTRNGNRHTALRWAAFLRQAGHRVSMSVAWSPETPADAMLALHARRSHASIKGFPREKPLVLALTGTDVYRDIHESAEARESLELADRLIVLQPKAAEELPAHLRRKVGVVVQSSSTRLRQRPMKGSFRVCVIGHLRAEKDPLRILSALEFVPPNFPLQVVQLGAALDPALVPKTEDPRYRWLGSVPHARALRIGVPVLASRISGNVGLLGADYRGYFPVGDEHALARLLTRAVGDRKFYANLKTQIAPLRSTVAPQAEKRALLAVMASPGLPR
jgi:glycosyltransferase involved in cell wall biosynthesis